MCGTNQCLPTSKLCLNRQLNWIDGTEINGNFFLSFDISYLVLLLGAFEFRRQVSYRCRSHRVIAEEDMGISTLARSRFKGSINCFLKNFELEQFSPLKRWDFRRAFGRTSLSFYFSQVRLTMVFCCIFYSNWNPVPWPVCRISGSQTWSRWSVLKKRKWEIPTRVLFILHCCL